VRGYPCVTSSHRVVTSPQDGSRDEEKQPKQKKPVGSAESGGALRRAQDFFPNQYHPAYKNCPPVRQGVGVTVLQQFMPLCPCSLGRR